MPAGVVAVLVGTAVGARSRVSHTAPKTTPAINTATPMRAPISTPRRLFPGGGGAPNCAASVVDSPEMADLRTVCAGSVATGGLGPDGVVMACRAADAISTVLW